MNGRINRCSHCGCDEPILGIDGKLYCDNCGMILENNKVAENKMLMKCPFCGRSVKWVKHLSARFVNIFGCVCDCGAEGSWQSTEKQSLESWSKWVRDGK